MSMQKQHYAFIKYIKSTNDENSDHPEWSYSHFISMLTHTWALRNCKCQRLVSQTRSQTGRETEPAKREGQMTGQTLVSCLTHSVSACQSPSRCEALLYHFMKFHIPIRQLIILVKCKTPTGFPPWIKVLDPKSSDRISCKEKCCIKL